MTSARPLLFPVLASVGLACLASVEGCTGDDPITRAGPDAATEAEPPPVDATSPDDAASADDAGADGSPDASDAGVDANISVTGVAYARAFDIPLARAPLQITSAGKTVDVAMGSDGTFIAPSITPPYTVAFEHDPPNAGTALVVFEGLTTKTPLLESGRHDDGALLGAPVQGTITGIANPIPAGTYVHISARNNGNGVTANIRGPGEAPTYAINPSWKGIGTRDVSVHVLAYEAEGPSDYPKNWIGYGEKTMSLSNGIASTGADIALGAVTTKTITGSFSPSTFAGTIELALRWGPRATEGDVMVFSAPATSPFSLVVPAPASSSLFVNWYEASLGSATYTAPTQGQSYAMTIPASPSLVAPAAGTTLAAGTIFSWTGPPGAVYAFTMQSTTEKPWVFVYTKATSLTLPVGFVPAAASSYTWSVRCFTTLSSVDALVGANGSSWYASMSAGGRQISVP